MKYAGIIYNDVTAAPGICVSVYTQGCHFHCPGCHNPETWDFNGGKEFTGEVMNKIIEALNKNGVDRSLCILGGEPLCEENLPLTYFILYSVKKVYPDKKIYIWTGYHIEDLLEEKNDYLDKILSKTNFIIDGPFIQEQRDITLQMRGSRNQRIIKLSNGNLEFVNGV